MDFDVIVILATGTQRLSGTTLSGSPNEMKWHLACDSTNNFVPALTEPIEQTNGEKRWRKFALVIDAFHTNRFSSTLPLSDRNVPETRANNVPDTKNYYVRNSYRWKNTQRKHIFVHYAYCRRRQRDSSCLLPRSSYDWRRLSLGSRQMAEKCVHKNDCSNRSSRC